MKLRTPMICCAFVLPGALSFAVGARAQAQSAQAAAPADKAPAQAFDLRSWKLQIPGPKDIKDLNGYTSPYFFLNENREMCFHLDAADKGATPNTKFVRSELRHLPNWKVEESHRLVAEVRTLPSHLEPDKVTILQIHGITDEGKDAPPLLRIALQKGDLMAIIQTSTERGQNETVLLKKGLKSNWARVDIRVERGRLTLFIDERKALERDLSFWKFSNYFKAGCYPQATMGVIDVRFRRLEGK